MLKFYRKVLRPGFAFVAFGVGVNCDMNLLNSGHKKTRLENRVRNNYKWKFYNF